MRRSEINAAISAAKTFFESRQFMLPPWAFWPPSAWKGKARDADEIITRMLGWDITDFGGNAFYARGLVLFTIRNGLPGAPGKPYAEKIMIVREEQETPMHFHRHKMEDIINRGGGNLVLELYQSMDSGGFSSDPVTVSVDGMVRTLPPGGTVILTPGESICLPPGLYHRFYGEQSRGAVLVGEVSMVNDDRTDNRFHESIGRFPDIDEDEEPLHLLVSDYSKYL
jgi:hypothetical protein